MATIIEPLHMTEGHHLNGDGVFVQGERLQRRAALEHGGRHGGDAVLICRQYLQAGQAAEGGWQVLNRHSE